MGYSPLSDQIHDHSTRPITSRRTPSFVYTASVAEAKDEIISNGDDDLHSDESMSLRTLTDDDDEFKPLDEELRRGPQVRRSHI